MTAINQCAVGYAPPPYSTTRHTTYAGAADVVPVGGTSVPALYGPLRGGFIYNPPTAADQGLDAPELLFVSLVGPAALAEGSGTMALLPGQRFDVPRDWPGEAVYVNAVSSGHAFTAVAVQFATQYPPSPYTGSYPPSGPTGLVSTLPAYVYKQYNDDDDILALFAAQNELSQDFLDWFNELNLPVYTGLFGALLDWVAEGLYGIKRPTLYSGLSENLGPYNTLAYDSAPYNDFELLNDVTDVTVTSDDVFKRILTWRLYRGDGERVCAEWVKRRVVRFLFGAGGADYEGSSAQISVVVGNATISITLVTGFAKLVEGSEFNTAAYGDFAYDEAWSHFQGASVPALTPVLVEAINTGALPLPCQYAAVCRAGALGVLS